MVTSARDPGGIRVSDDLPTLSATPAPTALLDGAVVVVTGAASGIGAALARRCTDQGAHVVLNDLHAAPLAALADELGGTAVPGDAADAEQVRALVDRTWRDHGRLDVFCANAGVAPAGAQDSDPAVWAHAWQVNVMSHVHAAQALLPRWLDEGRGRLVTTVSAAGLLTLLGKAPYAVTKHAALAFAEWLRATYQHRGIVVQAVCPQGVRTPMLEGADGASASMLGPDAISPEEVADAVLEALSDGRFLVLPHPQVAQFYAARATDPDRWLRTLNRMQQEIERAVPHPGSTLGER